MEKRNIKFYVERFIDKNPFIKEGLYEWYINSTGLAVKILPYIKNKLWENISLDSVKMTIHRLSKNIEIPTKIDLFKTKEIFIKKDFSITEIPVWSNIKKIIPHIDWKYYASIRWKKQKTFVFDNYYKKQVEENFKESKILSWLVLIWIKMDESLFKTKWVFYSISKELFFYWINIIQIIQTTNEFSIVIEENDLKNTIFAISNI